MKLSSNNRASTVYELFLGAVHKHQLPSRVHLDQGRENILVAQHMIEVRAKRRTMAMAMAKRRTMITGIEQLWSDMHHYITTLYYMLFYFMEHNDLLDPLNKRHLYVLHYVFLLAEEYQSTMQGLISEPRTILSQWREYQAVLESAMVVLSTCISSGSDLATNHGCSNSG